MLASPWNMLVGAAVGAYFGFLIFNLVGGLTGWWLGGGMAVFAVVGAWAGSTPA